MVGCNGPAESRVGDASPDKDTALNVHMHAGCTELTLASSAFQDSPFPGFHKKQTEPAATFSALLVHWVQNYIVT